MTELAGPSWLEPLDPLSRGIDQLGLRTPGLVMANALLPGFSNTTVHVRYYTLVAWLYSRAGKHGRRALETAFVHAVRLHHHEVRPGGVIGIDSVPLETDGVLPLECAKAIPSALQAQFYGPSARTLGLTDLDEDGEHACTTLGREIADAAAIPPECVPNYGAKSYQLENAKKLGKLCLCTRPAGAERDLLEDMLFRLVRHRPGAERFDGPRRRSLGLILHTLEDPASDVEQQVLQRMIDWALGRGGYEPPPALAEEAYGFAWLGMRWHFRHALELMWAGFGRLIRVNPSAGTAIAGFTDAVCAAGKGREVWAPSPERTIGEVVAALPVRGREGFLRDVTEREFAVRPASAMLAAAVQLGAIASIVPALQQPDRFYGAFPRLGVPDRVPLDQFAQGYSSELSVYDWVHHLLDRYAVSQHFLTAGRKWAERRDAFFFHVEEDGYRLRVDRWEPDAGRTRLPAATSLLTGLGLVRTDGAGSQTTGEGSKVLARVLADPGERVA